ncbi:putative tetratricopeptide repeat-containing domain-containing protein [Helianthus annuus]|nr:putative tetratricopeptide repeat-containing domain-containing protein [Helianthus annuus]
MQRHGKYKEAIKYLSMVLSISEREGEDSKTPNPTPPVQPQPIPTQPVQQSEPDDDVEVVPETQPPKEKGKRKKGKQVVGDPPPKEWEIITMNVDEYPEPKRSMLKKLQTDIMKKHQII